MATKKSVPTGEAIGPTQSGDGNPPNPQDRIFSGPIPTIPAQSTVVRRPFSEPTRPPLHFSDGGGPDEAVTSRRPNVVAPLGNVAAETDQHNNRPVTGVDPNKYAGGPDVSKTTNGVEIRGS